MEHDRFGRLASLAELGFEPVAEPPITAELEPVEGGGFRLTQVRPAMGTLVSVTAVHTSSWLIEEANGRAYAEMDRLIGLLNRYDDRSALSVLNQEGRLAGPPPELATVLKWAAHFHDLTGERFDVTVAPVVDLLRERIAGDGLDDPDRAEFAAALERVGFGHVRMSPTHLRFDRPDMRLTLDGIAKGHIVDAMAEVLRAHGLEDWLINAGGDIRASGAPEPGRPWRVAVRDPSAEGVLPDAVDLSNGAVATSGGYEIFYDPDRRHHHIVDGRSGASAAHSLGATVTAPDALTADALATSVFLMEPTSGLRFIDALPGCECLLVGRDGGVLTSAGWTSSSNPHSHRSPHEDGNTP
jgi:thiamine biosynthesis lipoprotein